MGSAIKDFIVEEQHVKPISDAINNLVSRKIWEDITSEFLSQGILNSIPDCKTFLQLLRLTISVWICHKSKDERKFSKLVEAVRRHNNPAAEKLEAYSSSWCKLSELPSTSVMYNNNTLINVVQVQKNKERILAEKWWPEQKFLINSHYERRTGNSLIIENIYKALKLNHEKTTVISQKAAVSGMGGVGKTTTAIWFANYYQEKYDYIFWIDCGEGVLSTSFRKLARKLNIENRDELNLKETALEVFQKLSDWKCLFIYDNAECYVGSEGVQEVLPKNKPKFHCLITSRHTEWGDNRSFGEIAKIQLESFTLEEGLQFMKKNLENVEYHDFHLKELSSLLGHLPLALQIVVATLNNKRRVSITEYIHSVKTTAVVLNATTKLNEYEKCISQVMQFSINLIKKEPSGNNAVKILSIFGYICPDNISADYFSEITKIPIYDIDDALDLLSSHSLINKSGQMKAKIRINFETLNFFKQRLKGRKYRFEKVVDRNVQLVSIHRLLQQVIRYNEGKSEKSTLRCILNCPEFIENKLIPYKHAEKHGDMKKTFFYIRAQLIEQLNLKVFWKQQRYVEAVQLSRLIHEGFSEKETDLFIASLYNHAICLWKNGELNESIQNLKTILRADDTSDIESWNNAKIEYFEDFQLFDIKNYTAHQIKAQLCVQLEIHRKEIDDLTKEMNREKAHSISVYFHGEGIPCDLNKINAFRRAQVKGKILYELDKGSLEDCNDEFVMEELQLLDVVCVNRDGGRMENTAFHEMFNGRVKKLVLWPKEEGIISVDFSKMCDMIQDLQLRDTKISFADKSSSSLQSLKSLELFNCTLTWNQNQNLEKFTNMTGLSLLKTFVWIPLSLKSLGINDCTFELPPGGRELILPRETKANGEQLKNSKKNPEIQLDYFEFCKNKFVDSNRRLVDEIWFNDFCSVGIKHLNISSSFTLVQLDCSQLPDCIETLLCNGKTRLTGLNKELPLKTLKLRDTFDAGEMQRILFACPHLLELQLYWMLRGSVHQEPVKLPPTLQSFHVNGVNLDFSSQNKLKALHVVINPDNNVYRFESVARFVNSLSAEYLLFEILEGLVGDFWKSVLKNLVNGKNTNYTNVYLDCTRLSELAMDLLIQNLQGLTRDQNLYRFRNGQASAITRKEWNEIVRQHFSLTITTSERPYLLKSEDPI